MTTKFVSTNRQLVDQTKYETILIDWVEATTDFYSGYNQLVACLCQKVGQEKLSTEKIIYIGQCPMAPVVSLLRTMEMELERLLQDVGLFDTLQQVSITEKYRKLAAHTLALKRFNRQIQTRLLLMDSTTQ